MFDMPRADLSVIALGNNDWQADTATATVKSYLSTAIARQRSSGTTQGGSHANGDVALVFGPTPDLTALVHTNPSYEQYRTAFYEVADSDDVMLIDITPSWVDFTTADTVGLFADTVHPSDDGAEDIAQAVYEALFVRV
jgi:lysophospholipase L1-like esterase